MRAAVLLFPGLNRESDVMRALEMVSGIKPSLVWHAETDLPTRTDLVVVPGGFSYGDYLRCGAIAGRATLWTPSGAMQIAEAWCSASVTDFKSSVKVVCCLAS